MSSKIRAKFFRRADVKMTLLYILTFSLSALIICGFLYLRLKHQLIKEVDRLLLDETDELSSVLSQSPGGVEGLRNFEAGVGSRTYYPISFKVLTADNTPLYTSEGFKTIQYKMNESMMANVKGGREVTETIQSPVRRTPYRVVGSPVYKDGRLAYIVQVGTHLRFVRKSLSVFKRNIFAAFPIVLVLGSLGGWILARRSLMPIGYIASKAQMMTSKSLNERLIPRGAGDEMDDLIETINGMISRLEESFKRMAEFTADVSHELKTPLCALKGEAEVLLSRGRGADEYQEGLAHFIERFEQLNRMINDLILLSKTDSSQVELKMDPVRLDLLINDMGDIFQVLAEQKKVALKIDPIQETVIIGDKGRLQQLFTSLLDNAIKYTSKGSIRVTVEKNEEVVLIKIHDTGIGIPKEEQEKIFKRFYRVDKSRSKETGGVGLGLSIAEWIAQAHHGRIEVESELNKGSTFIVYLPVPKA